MGVALEEGAQGVAAQAEVAPVGEEPGVAVREVEEAGAAAEQKTHSPR